MDISSGCRSLAKLYLQENSDLGSISWTIGNFTYNPKTNDVSANNHPNGEKFVGHEISASSDIDWHNWVGNLRTLRMDGCKIRFYIEASWGSGGGCTWDYWIRYGSYVPEGMIAFHKKWKADGAFSQNSKGWLKFNDTEVSYCSVEGWAGTQVINYKGTTVSGNHSISISLPDQRVKYTVYDEWTQHFSHDFIAVAYPFGN